MALVGFGVVFELFPFLYVGAKAAGAAYLLYIAYRMWRSAGVPVRAVINRIFRGAEKGLDAQVLLDPFEEQFHLPSMAVQFGDGGCRYGEMVGKKVESPVRLRIAIPEPTGRAFRQGSPVNLFNPKSVLFAAAVLVTVFPAGSGLADSIVIVANHFLVEIAFYTALAFGMSTQAVAKRYVWAKNYIDRAAAAVLGALGVRILLSR